MLSAGLIWEKAQEYIKREMTEASYRNLVAGLIPSRIENDDELVLVMTPDSPHHVVYIFSPSAESVVAGPSRTRVLNIFSQAIHRLLIFYVLLCICRKATRTVISSPCTGTLCRPVPSSRWL